MSLLKRIIGALRDDDQVVPEAATFGVSVGGQSRMQALPDGVGVLIARVGEEGETIQLSVCEAKTTDRVTVDGFDGARLRGLLLDYDSESLRWRFLLDFSLHAKETPNPDGRLYRASRRIGHGEASFHTRRTVNPLLIRRILEHPGVESVLIRAHTVTLERSGTSVGWNALDAHLDRVLREYFLAAGVELVAQPTEYHDAFEAEVAKVLEERVLPAVHRDGGDLRLLEVRDG
ncbi:MAG: NifU N-terminal domain-containing protein, partial [Myxococcota bacterium]